MSVGANLKRIRKTAGDTQGEAARKVGVNKNTYGNYERDDREPGSDFLIKFADTYNTTIDDILGLTPDYGAILNLSPLPAMKQVPRLGEIACGEPIMAEENWDGQDAIPLDIDADYTLVCRGDSMTGIRINDGDIVCIKQQSVVENGEIAAVLVDGTTDGATLKRFMKMDNSIVLMPANDAYQPMVFFGHEMNRVHIIGKAVYFISKLR